MTVDPDTLDLFSLPNDSIVGHYTVLETLLIILSTGKLKFSPMKEMNDPWEKEPRAVFKGESSSPQQWSGYPLRTALLNHVKLFCTTHSQPLHSQDQQFPPKFDYLTSDNDFSQAVNGELVEAGGSPRECHSRLRMWEQYGGQRKGACLLFDRHQLREQIHKEFKRNVTGFVEYVESWRGRQMRQKALTLEPPGESDDFNKRVEEHLNANCPGLWFLKELDWVSESEFRFAIYDKGDGPVYVKFGNALKAIVLGWECDQSLKSSIGKLADVPVCQLFWNQVTGRLEIDFRDLIDRSK